MEKHLCRLVALVLPLLFSAGVRAQIFCPGKDARTLLKEDITRYANLHHNYEAPAEVFDTPAPKGYKPFYVSHYGRHGSRYHYNARFLVRPLTALDSLEAHGLLTEEGREIRAEIKLIEDAHRGQVGYLTHKGAAQHREIAARLCDRCPGLFRQKDRDEVFCAATAVQRCIQSMANFCVSLAGRNPELRITMDAGDRFADYLSNKDGVPPFGGREISVLDSALVVALDPSRILNAWTTDPEAAVRYMRHGDPRRFAYDVLWAGSIAQCLDIEDPRIDRHYTFDEIYGLWAYNDIKECSQMVGTVENGRTRDVIGARILKDILERADSALAPGSRRAADLRFGHDTGLSPLFSLLRLEGLEESCKMADAPHGIWYAFEFMPMASNLQLIFYRDRKGDTLVKILRNERETTIPALPTQTGPYYRWDDLRAYFKTLVDSALN